MEPCKYEETIGGMAANISHIKNDQAETKETTSKIFRTLEGKNGLVSRVAVLETKQNDIPSIKAIMIQASIWGGLTGGAIVIMKHFVG